MNTPLSYTREETNEVEFCDCAYCKREFSVEEGIFHKDWNEDEYDFVCDSCRGRPVFIERRKRNEQEIEEILSDE